MHYLQRHGLVLLVWRVLYAHAPSSPVHPVLVLLVVMHVAKVVEGRGVTGMGKRKRILSSYFKPWCGFPPRFSLKKTAP